MASARSSPWRIAILAACGTMAIGAWAADPAAPAGEGAAGHAPLRASVDADGVQRVLIVGGSYYFRPERVIAKPGQLIEFTLRTTPGMVPHRFVVEAPDGRVLADVPLSEEPRTLRLVLAPGRYAFLCPNRLPFMRSHRERGMAGVLDVEE